MTFSDCLTMHICKYFFIFDQFMINVDKQKSPIMHSGMCRYDSNESLKRPNASKAIRDKMVFLFYYSFIDLIDTMD